MARRKKQAPGWRVPDELWERVEPLLPKYQKSKQGGRPRADSRRVLDGILYVLRTGCQWKAVPQEFGSPSTLHDYFQERTEKGLFFRLWKEALWEYDALEAIDWGWQSLDEAMTKAPLGGERTRPNPTDRAKPGTERSLLTDGDGVPLAAAIAGANTHAKRLVEPTLQRFAPRWPPPKPSGRGQHFCGDKAYDRPDIRALLSRWGYTLHIKSRGEEARELRCHPPYRARRWLVERSHFWLNQLPRMRLRWSRLRITERKRNGNL